MTYLVDFNSSILAGIWDEFLEGFCAFGFGFPIISHFICLFMSIYLCLSVFSTMMMEQKPSYRSSGAAEKHILNFDPVDEPIRQPDFAHLTQSVNIVVSSEFYLFFIILPVLNYLFFYIIVSSTTLLCMYFVGGLFEDIHQEDLFFLSLDLKLCFASCAYIKNV
ncbi:hypothetical protein ACJX0J_024334, partial [Zea mays]